MKYSKLNEKNIRFDKWIFFSNFWFLLSGLTGKTKKCKKVETYKFLLVNSWCISRNDLWTSFAQGKISTGSATESTTGSDYSVKEKTNNSIPRRIIRELRELFINGMGYCDDDNQREADESLNQKDYQEQGSMVFMTVQRYQPGYQSWDNHKVSGFLTRHI